MEDLLKNSEGFQYIDQGQGEPIILLHGLFGALSNFKEVLDEFSKTHRVLIPMLPLYSMPILNTGVKSLSEFLNDFLNHLQIKQATLLGNSLGGHVALVFTKNHIEKVKALILTASSGLYENAFGSSFPRREDKEYIRKKVAVTFYDPKWASDELVDECFSLVNDRNRVIRILALAKSAIRHNMADDLQYMNIPVCLIWGKNDTITPPEVAEEFHAKLSNSELFWINECGHAPMMEHPNTFNEILRDWINKKKI
jgi:pimeloyl-ACP methyl ester carboxylesterase